MNLDFIEGLTDEEINELYEDEQIACYCYCRGYNDFYDPRWGSSYYNCITPCRNYCGPRSNAYYCYINTSVDSTFPYCV